VAAAAESSVLAELAASGLELDALPKNPAKIRLLLDLVGELRSTPRVRVLDVGCGGEYSPFNVFAPLRARASELELVGVDVAHLGPTAARARELGFDFTPVEGSATELLAVFPAGSFDVVVSTQVLEHLRRWREALRAMRDVVKVGGAVLVTCDSGDLRRRADERVRLAAKRGYARAVERRPALRRVLRPVVSGEWEEAPTLDEVREETRKLGLEVERLDHFGLRGLKDVQDATSGHTRALWLAYEEELARRPGDAGLYKLLYLRARRRA
jgi:SAM-dependent methyltransferase